MLRGIGGKAAGGDGAGALLPTVPAGTQRKSLATAMTDRVNARGKTDPVADLLKAARKHITPPPVPAADAGRAPTVLDDEAVAQTVSSLTKTLGEKGDAPAPRDLSRATRELLSIMLSDPA
ncbi:hypothetical protein BMR85_024375 [Achromobacter sp. KAs 3-5]|nr:hypothetical protein BMR85_024375 [Achromobacter sp. KAs 3-5]